MAALQLLRNDALSRMARVPPMKPPPLRRLWEYAEAHRGHVIRASLWSILNKTFDIAPPVLIGMAVDIVVNQESSFLSRFGFETPRSQLVLLSLLSFVIYAFESLFEYLHGVSWRNLAQNVQHEIRLDAYAHMQHLEMAYFEEQSTGNLMAILNDDVNQLERFLDTGANEVLQVSTTVVLIGATFFVLAPSIAWVAFVPIPVIVWGSFRFQRRLEPRYAEVRDQAGAIGSLLANNLGGMATIKAFTAEDREEARVAAESDAYRSANYRAITLSAAFSPLIRMAILVGFMATLLWGGLLALEGSLAVGAYSVMVFLTQRLLWPLTRLGQTFDLYQRAMASTNRILDVLDTPAEIISGDAVLDRSQVVGRITFKDVGFAYRTGFPVLCDIDLDLPPGATTAFVGSTGSGKTTLIKLLMRFYDVGSGAIILDGHDIRSLELHHLRRAMAVVGQDVFLFHGTVWDNIAYGKPEASRNEILHAAEVAEAHRFIMALPEGYDTVVGERGQKLSGGQRQRLSIARAVLVDPPILILDEATSSVDNETEAAIQRSLARLVLDRSTIVIAHRLSTIRHADTIHVIENGYVVESGTHDQLLDLEGSYATLWRVQTGEAVD
jgi:ATP-binding cassette subfamily B protein